MSGNIEAMKTIRLDTSEDSKYKALAEVEVMRKINHTHIVELYDSFEDNGYLCLVMELATLGSLFEKIE